MKLLYHKGENFGDAINPMIFNRLFGALMEQNDGIEILGIGSILGHARPSQGCEKFIVFSSGFAGGDSSTYGNVPELNDKFEIVCVRGKKTAKALGIEETYAIADGALLVSRLLDIPAQEKKYQYSYMPHVGSMNLYKNWPELVESLGIHFIDPTKDPMQVLKEMKQTEVLMTEAMHGAIIADSLQLPWLPIKTNQSINEFKWNDYLETVDLEYLPNETTTLYDKEVLDGVFKKKLQKFRLQFFSSTLTFFYQILQNFKVKKVQRNFESFKSKPTYNCKADKLKELQDKLLAAAERVKGMV